MKNRREINEKTMKNNEKPLEKQSKIDENR